MKKSAWYGQVENRSKRLIARMTDNTSGTQLAAAQTAGGNLDQLARSNVIIAPSTTNNSQSSPMVMAEGPIGDTEHIKTAKG